MNIGHFSPGDYLSFGRSIAAEGKHQECPCCFLTLGTKGNNETISTIKMRFNLYHQNGKASLIWDDLVCEKLLRDHS